MQAQNLKGGRTGWPPGLLQDDSRELSVWLATRPDARYVARKALLEYDRQRELELLRKMRELEAA